MKDEAIWGKFNIRWCNVQIYLKTTGDDWNKFSSSNSQIFIPTQVEEQLITEKEGKEHKNIDSIMETEFSR
jgi:hypothetical protein